MNKQMSFVALASLVVLAGLVWLVARSQRNEINTSAGPVAMAPYETPVTTPKMQAAVAAPQPIAQPLPTVVDDPTRHVAQPGETVNSMAGDLLGKNDQANRDAIINANPSLKANPDRLLAGKSYHIPPVTDVPAQVVAAPVEVVSPAEQAIQPPAIAVQPEPVKVLKYSATTGDTVSNLAGAFLGNDDQKHQDQIVNANPSLQANPDRVVAGKVYRIPAPNGLSATPASLEPNKVAFPTSQPDADQVVADGSPRSLRYTARDGDTVTTLAIQLLGSDTQQTRDAIINDNPTLKKNPDRVIAGQTYWIPAPTTPAQNP